MIIELKRNRSLERAIRQIREKDYAGSLENYRGDIMLVGINYDDKDKTHECRIEQIVRAL